MIKTFQDNHTEDVFYRRHVRKFSSGLQRVAYRKLLIIDAAETLDDLKVPPGNRLEKLTGNRKDQYSIRINDQWRICFSFRQGDAYNVEITDYH